MNKWKGKVALVSGASTGIGANISKALANSGLTVIGLGRRVEAIQVCLTFSICIFSIFNLKFSQFNFECRLLQELSNQVQNGKIIAKKCDVTNEDEVLAIFKWIKDKFGHLDVFVNNAGVIKSNLLLGNY